MRFIIILVIVIAIIGASLAELHTRQNKSPIPTSVSKSVSFSIYYPDPKKLPKGYVLDTNSFANPVKNGVSYTVSYGNNQKMVFSIQPKPSDSALKTFEGSYMPLRTAYQTPVGQAELGAYNSKTLVSLPTNSSTWIIITAPPNINQDQLKQVLQSIKKP